jgi:cytochrome c55X
MRTTSLIAAGLTVVLTTAASAQSPAPDREREHALVRLVRQDCGSCHGLTLRGGLGPSLLPRALRDKPVDSLRATILLGRPGTAMPPWQGILNEADADWILVQLLAGFPQENGR